MCWSLGCLRRDGFDPGDQIGQISSSPAGLLIPPSSTLIVHSLITGGTSIAALFVAGYDPGI